MLDRISELLFSIQGKWIEIYTHRLLTSCTVHYIHLKSFDCCVWWTNRCFHWSFSCLPFKSKLQSATYSGSNDKKMCPECTCNKFRLCSHCTLFTSDIICSHCHSTGNAIRSAWCHSDNGRDIRESLWKEIWPLLVSINGISAQCWSWRNKMHINM